MRMPHTTRQQRELYVRQFEDSSMTQEEFARHHHLNLSTFRNWLYDFRKQQEQAFRFLEVEVQAMTTTERVPHARLHLCGHLMVEFEAPPTPSYLVQLLNALENR